ncbi:MAG TPA: c-type cytochrome [Gammaproteobacteria bacterium]|nr:c-type cytochrome [Gammaproteobacteria bacterium]
MNLPSSATKSSLVLALFILFSAPSGVLAEPKNLDEIVDKALRLKPDLENGKKLYRNCALCHTPEGWGSPGGRFPQIAGQHQSVILKQLADIHDGNRDNPTMYPFSERAFAQGAQALADLSAYVARLPMVPNNTVGPGADLELGKKLYHDNCKKCHGANGEGDPEEFYPRIAGQHFLYLLRQLEWIKIKKRRNADEKMVKQIHGFDLKELSAVADYVSRLRPDKTLLADHLDWRNPDFRRDFRTAQKAQRELAEEGDK